MSESNAGLPRREITRTPPDLPQLAKEALSRYTNNSERTDVYFDPESHLELFQLELSDDDIPTPCREEPVKTKFIAEYTSLVTAELRRQTHTVRKLLKSGHIQHNLEAALSTNRFDSPKAATSYLQTLYDELNAMNEEELRIFFDTNNEAHSSENDPKIAGHEWALALDIFDSSEQNIRKDIARIQDVAPNIKQDAIRRAEMMVELHEGQYRDTLTGILNKAGIERRFMADMRNAAINADPNMVIFVGRFDLNSFKDINTLLTHSGADELLKKIAKTLSSKLRVTDAIARAGGDEFMIVTTVDRAGVSVLAKNILDAVRAITYTDGDIETPVGLAGGFYLVEGTDNTTTFQDADRYADEVSFLAKLGDSQFLQYSEEVFQTYREILLDTDPKTNRQADLLRAVADAKYKRELEGYVRQDNMTLYELSIQQRDIEITKQRTLLDQALDGTFTSDTIYTKILRPKAAASSTVTETQ